MGRGMIMLFTTLVISTIDNTENGGSKVITHNKCMCSKVITRNNCKHTHRRQPGTRLGCFICKWLSIYLSTKNDYTCLL